jgi:hypothetical protein
MVAPILAAIVHPWAGPPAAAVLIAVMTQYDRAGPREASEAA